MLLKMKLPSRPRSAVVAVAAISTALVIFVLLGQPADAFRISFGHRLFKAIQQHSNPQLNPPDTLIRPIECRNANNHSEAGICMFSIDCMQNKGVPLSVCKHNYFVGTCCKLPDYNNFVGIVYDLRETESASQLLEARRAAASSGQLELGASAPLVKAHVAATSDLQQPTSSSELPPLSASSRSDEFSSTIAQQLEGRSSTREASESFSPTTTTMASTTTLAAHVPVQPVEKSPSLDEKYVISSSRLFASVPSASSTTPSNIKTSADSTTASLETARNADGSLGQQQISQTNGEIIKQLNNATSNLQQPIVLTNDLREQQAGAYEVLAAINKTDKSEAPLINGLDTTQDTLVSSAHSAPNRQQQQQNSVYLLAEESEVAPSRGVPTSIVFASNHQPSNEARLQQKQQQQQQLVSSLAPPTSDQEFTLSTSAAHEDAASSSSSVSSLILNSIATSTTVASQAPSSTSAATSTATEGPIASQASVSFNEQPADLSSPTAAPSSQAASESTVSSYVDLISSHSTAQTTTPFTSSLSTAILPNISSHPYAPTTLAPFTSSTLQALVSSSSSTSESTPPASQETSSSSPSPSPLFYSTAGHLNLSGGGSQQSPAHSSRPGGPQVASKIVTSNSGANNLIPGLSGLQSAILSHIPFKIASGLSSGLSSYLQAAMKPNNAGRPLISSNTAPALQYQQQANAVVVANNSASSTFTNNHHHQQAASKPAAGAVRFPGGLPAPASSTVAPQAQPPPPPPPPMPLDRDVVREAQLVCGRPQVSPHDVMKKRVARIVGGNQSSFGQWPWMVSLRQWRKGAFLHKCGAALLNEHWAITAAHCVENVKAPDLLLRLGEFDVSNQNEPYPYTERRVKSVVAHPSFDPKTFEYDLALIKFAEPIQFERNIIPVCVPSGNDSYVDRMATVIGWGRLYEDGPLPDVIQHVDVPIITNQECEKMYKNAGFVEEIPEMFICAGISKGGRDSCEGDSGGPLTMVDHDGRSYLVGIISWGIGCALPSQPGVYTRITAFSPWINSIIST